MNDKIQRQYLDLKYMDILSQKDSVLHKFDPRILLITTLFYLIAVISFDPYSISALIPFFLYPTMLLTLGDLPFTYFLRKIILVSPFILIFAFLNLFFNENSGFLSSLSLIIRFILTVSSGLMLIAIIGIHGICQSLDKLYLPRPFVTQLLLLYRYLFILLDELSKMMLAKDLRQTDSKPLKFKTYISILGHLFLRSLDRAERIYLAMCARGFSGELYLSRKNKIRTKDFAFLTIWSLLFIFFRLTNISLFWGSIFTR